MICWCLREYSDLRISLFNSFNFKFKILIMFNWKSIKSLIFFSFSSFSSIFSQQDRSSVAVCLISETWQTVKSKSWIHAIHWVTRASDKSQAEQLSWAIKVLTSSSNVKCIEYRYSQHFLSIFKTSWHSLFPALYYLSIFNQIPLSYQIACCHFSSCSVWDSISFQSCLLASILQIISPESEK